MCGLATCRARLKLRALSAWKKPGSTAWALVVRRRESRLRLLMAACEYLTAGPLWVRLAIWSGWFVTWLLTRAPIAGWCRLSCRPIIRFHVRIQRQNPFRADFTA